VNAGGAGRSARNIWIDTSVALITAAKANRAVDADCIGTSW